MNWIARICSALFAAPALFAVVNIPAAQSAAGQQSCGLHGTNQGSFALVVQSGALTCQQARAVFDDMFAGKGTQTSRNGSAVDGYACTGNPAGAFHDTGVLSFCDGNGVHLELRNP